MTTFHDSRTARAYRLPVKWLGIGTLLLASSGAWAACSGGPSTVAVTMPSTVSVPRDAAVGTVLTPWVTTAASTNYWNCSYPTLTGFGIRSMVNAYNVSSGTTATSSNGSFTVWNTGVPGIGIAIGYRYYIGSLGDCAGTTGWGTWRSPGTTWAGLVCTNGSNKAFSSTYGTQVTAALVKTAAVISAGGTVAGGTIAQSVMMYGGTNQTGAAYSYQMNSINIVPLLCSTPNVSVSLGKHQRSEFKGVGYTTATVDYNFNIQDCPAGLNTIRYRFDALTTVLNSSQSVVALDSTSQATGLGVQLLDGTGSALALATYKTFADYKTATGGSYSIPLKARYYQTAANVTVGKARSGITVTMLYQ